MQAPDLNTDHRHSRIQALADAMPHALWRGNALGAHAAPGIATGYAQLNAELPGGGWPPSMLTELLWAQQGSGEFRLLAPVLSRLSQAGKTIVLLAPPHTVFAPALAQAGIDISQLLIIQTDKPADRLWAIEQVLKSASFGAMLCWLPQARPEHLRRLQLASAGCEGLAFVFRPAAARHESSPAPLRLSCQADHAGTLAIEVFKRRGPAAAEPIILPALLPGVIMRGLFAVRSASLAPALKSKIISPGTSHALDRPLPAAAAARPRHPSLA